MARGQFDNVMQQSQAKHVHKEPQDTIAQLEAIRNMDVEKAGDGALPVATPSLPTSAAKLQLANENTGPSTTQPAPNDAAKVSTKHEKRANTSAVVPKPSGINVNIHPHVKLAPEILTLDAEEQVLFGSDVYKQDVANRLLKLLILGRVNRIPLSVIDRLKWDLAFKNERGATIRKIRCFKNERGATIRDIECFKNAGGAILDWAGAQPYASLSTVVAQYNASQLITQREVCRIPHVTTYILAVNCSILTK
ncbi:hypothetical protein M8C21_002728 [Ambrosia artemisiifolia]|uniref:PORR domain-containing protein n=1 Tax=Ambrosia artemisiifolia TaxID=4212 RepID=A0AAD5CQ23_AMBAR|nr:hypothetical protein M8C21_002728 [Ambrosia artemisiifolia]